MILEGKPISFKFEKITEVTNFYIELLPTYYRLHARYLSDKPNIAEDWDSGSENSLKCYDVRVKRELMSAVGKQYVPATNTWEVYIESNGVSGYCTLYHKRESAATEMLEVLTDYMLGKIIKE